MTSTTRKERRRVQQKQEILAAARELFLREGREHFSMRELAKEVGCVPGTLYLYFKDKNDLIATLVEDSFEQLIDSLQRPQRNPNSLVFLKEIMRVYIDFGLANPNHYHFAFMLRRTPSLEEARPRPHRSYTLLVDTVRACKKQKYIRVVDVELAAQGIWAGIHGVTSLMITMPNFPWGDRDRVIGHVVNSLLDGLRPPSKTVRESEGATDDSES